MDENGSATPRSPALSVAGSATLSPTWRPPKSPLPPHRLAKLANALGVSTPIPANQSPTTYTSRSFSDIASPNTTDFRRSPTPSSLGAASSMGFNSYQPTTSKFLLHVIPPKHLPHDSDDSDESSLPTPNAPGYHTQFRRGTLVPVHSTLQAQLGAIAKEYALPSPVGLILYLVSSSSQSPLPDQNDEMDEPGPRLSEEVWKHLWTRVLRTEQRDDMLMPSLSSRSATPSTPHLHHPLSPASALSSRSTPFLLQDSVATSTGPLRPFISASSPSGDSASFPLSPQPQYSSASGINSPSTPSTVSDRRSNNKSAPPSSSFSQSSEPDTPDTSVDEAAAAALRRGAGGDSSSAAGNFLNLPGLNSPSLIPILAKVEFDIDRRKAAWYEPWVRSRRANHAKRTGAGSRKNSRSRASSRSRERGRSEGELEDETRGGERPAPIEFLTGKKDKKDPFGLKAAAAKAREEEEEAAREAEEKLEEEEEGQYARLSESPEEMNSDSTDSDTEDLSEEATAKVSLETERKEDPLEDVFGTDADTWADIHAEAAALKSKSGNSNPNIVELALTAEELSVLPDVKDLEEKDDRSTKEEDEVMEMLDIMRSPTLALSIPSPDKNQRSSSPPLGTGGRKVPPPLVLKPKEKSGAQTVISSESSPLPVVTPSPTGGLAYLSDETHENHSANKEDQHQHQHQADEDDLLEGEYNRVRSPEESEKRGGAVFDDLDLGLDPTEDYDEDDPDDRRRSQLLMKAQLDEIERTMAQLSPRILKTDLEEEHNMSFNSVTLSPRSPAGSLTLSPGNIRFSDAMPSQTPSPRLPRHPDPPEDSSPPPPAGASWPAVPFSAIRDKEGSSAANPNAPPSPPRLAVNGITTSAPRSYQPSRPPGDGPSESERRKKLEEEEGGLYGPGMPSMKRDPSSDSPVIPLSPDPFGRHPSTNEGPMTYQLSGADWDTMTVGKGAMASLPETPPHAAEAPAKGRARSNTTSRFSTDSINVDEPAPSTKSQNRGTLMSVKSLKKLWRKSNNKSSSSHSVPPTPTATTSSGRSSPMVPPQRPERPSQEELDLPDVPNMPPPPANFGRLSPQPAVPPMPSRRPSVDQQNGPPMQMQMQMQPQPSSNQLGPPAQPPYMGQLSIPSYPGRNPNPGPIVTPFMQAARTASNLDRLHFDQESPYPVRMTPSIRQSPRAPSPTQLPAIPEQDGKGGRKSILRWKSAGSSSSGGSSVNGTVSGGEPQPRSSFERPPSANSNPRGRRPSVINFGSTRGSAVTSPDLPPSPQIPNQYVRPGAGAGAGGLEHRQSQRSRLTTSSTDSSYFPPQRQPSLQSQSSSLGARSASPPRSLASSRDSEGSRPSFDASQFEFVSPTAGSLSYPYNRLDH
ncbi:hypothetical protein CPC08DRAFT_680638 [Agrocybe pediades]|nr:hypothetical protein CPC08DRAFT_680638 [Agrocybe pediades]